MRLAALFGEYRREKVGDFLEATKNLVSVYRGEQILLSFVEQVCLVNWLASDVKALGKEAHFTALTEHAGFAKYIEAIEKAPWDAEALPKAFLGRLKERGVVFQSTQHGEMRSLLDGDLDEMAKELGVFVGHQVQVRRFLQAHVAVPKDKSVKESLGPLLGWLKQLQLRQGEANEVVLVISALMTYQKESDQKAKRGIESQYWSVDDLYGLLTGLHTEEQRVYPVSILKRVLDEASLKPKGMEALRGNFPVMLKETWQQVLSAKVLTREQQGQLCQLATKEYAEKETVTFTQAVLGELVREHYSKDLRGHALGLLLLYKNMEERQKAWVSAERLLRLEVINEKVVTEEWQTTCSLWLRHLKAEPVRQALGTLCQVSDKERRGLLLTIAAFAGLRKGLLSERAYTVQLERKLSKLVEMLMRYSVLELRQIVACYPQLPCPQAVDLLRLDKGLSEDFSLAKGLEVFGVNPHGKLRTDYGRLSVMRKQDLSRMLRDSRVVRGVLKEPLSSEAMKRFGLLFSYLKRLETGDVKLKDLSESVKKMTQAQLRSVFDGYQGKQEKDLPDEERMQLWAVVFEVIERTTTKYENLGQVFALLGGEATLEGTRQGYKVATGEGKTILMLAMVLRDLALGKKAHVYTATQALAERDREENAPAIAYVGRRSTNLSVKSGPETLPTHDVVYGVLGELPLHLAYCAYELNQPVTTDFENCVGYFDEFDFIRFDEGTRTAYNFAVDAGKAPEQMRWFYRAVNGFYVLHRERLKAQEGIDESADIEAFIAFMEKEAGEHVYRQEQVEVLKRTPLEAIRWIQAAHDADGLERGVQFALLEGAISVGEETYDMHEIVPLSMNNQKMRGSSYSEGVDQLKAELLNETMKESPEPCTVHLRRESDILSSQVAVTQMELYPSWKVFSGSFSTRQAERLYEENGMMIFEVPTNQACLREWKPIVFCETEDSRFDWIVKTIEDCLKKKESFLLACPDDKTVDQLINKLKIRLKHEDFSQLLPFTSESQLSVTDLLEKKYELEDWQHGQAQKSVGLIASSLSRGLNLQIRRSISLALQTETEELQTAGRAARQGEAGSVERAYVWPQVKKAHQELLQHAKRYDVKIEEVLAKVRGSDPSGGRDDKTGVYRELLYLKEYVSELQTQAQTRYQEAVSDYSGWVMIALGELGRLGLQEEKETLKRLWLEEFADVRRAWMVISSDETLAPLEKGKAIREKIQQRSTEFVNRCASEVKSWKTLGLSDFKGPRVRDAQKHTSPVASASEAPEVLEACVSAVLSEISSTSATSNDKFLADFSTKLELLSPVLQKNIQADQTFLALSKSYTTDPDTRFKFLVLLHESVSVMEGKRETRLRWLSQCEGLLCHSQGTDKAADGHFLMHVCEVMKGSLDEATELKLGRFLKETESFWGKLPRGRYEKLLRSFWEQLATQVTRTQGGEAIRRLPSEALGELAFKWPLEYWQLSSETLSVHWPFLAQVMELLGTLKAGSKIKKLLFDQVVAFLKDSPKEFRFEKGYLEQTLAFFARPENKQRVVNGQMIAELKYALSTGEGEEMMFRRHLFQLMLQEPLTASWKLKEFDAYFEKLNPLLAVESGLRDKRMIWKKGTILIRDFEQSMALVNALSVYPQSYLLLQSDEGSAFLRFLRLTQDYKEYFSGGAKLYDFLFKDRLNVKNRLSQCELCCKLLKIGAFRVDEMAKLYGAMEVHPLFTAERLPSLLLVLKQHPQLGRELIDLLLPQPELSLEAMAFLVEQWVQFDEALRRCLLPQEWVQKTKVLFSQLLTEKQTVLILALMQYPQKAQWLITDLFLVNLTDLEVDQFTHFINQLMSLYQALEKCALTNDAKLKIKNDFVNLTPEKRAVFFMAMEQYPQKAPKIIADFPLLNTFSEDQINLLINQLMRLQEVTDRYVLQKDIKKLFLELSVEKRAEFIFLIEGHPQQAEQLLIDLAALNLQSSQSISLDRELLKLYQLLDKSLLSKDLNQKIKDAFLSIESKEKRSAFLHFIQRYEKVFESNTDLVPIVVKHFGRVGSDVLQQVEIICKLVGEKKQEKEILEKISATVFLLKNKEAQKLDELITKYPEHAMPLLTDGVVSYCLQEEGTSPYLMQVTTLFYQLLKENDEDVSSLMVDERVKEWFNFESENSVYPKKRQIWMRLLYQGIWISSKEEKLWTEEKNAELLEKGFDQYTHFAAKILSKEKTQNTGDLTLDQQTKLLHLSQELQAIQSPIQKNITVKQGVLHDSAGHINDLKKEADIVIRQYASIWKTPDRTNQLQKFQKDWESAIMAQTDKSRYENVLVVIEKAKREVINADKEANKRSWLKKNRKGYSHYLNTLDRLYNLVSTHWARDLEAIGAFSQHEQKFVERFHQSLEALRITFSTSEEKEFAVLYHLLNETQQLLLEGEEVESKKATRNINQSVDGSENDNQIEDETDINQDKKLPAFVTERRKTLLHAQLEHDLPKLPGHLATLARMALSQAEALSLSKQDPVENNLRQLLIELYKKIDAYEMGSDRSNERKASVVKLKQVLIKAMLTDKSHENLLSEIETIKMGVIDRDNQVNEEILFWKVNRKGHSDYLRLLSDLESHIVTHWVANDRDAQVQRQDKKQLQKRFSSLTAKLLSAAEAFVKEERSLVQKITSGVFSQGADLFALVNVLKQVNLATDSKLLNELLDRLGDPSFLPGEICALADQVVKIGQELKLHITAQAHPSF